ncbi:MAG: LicD family protein, partial [Lachnospiraceae bacterium]|nr:LicD family protein [Lachnospiraceae bacterium]
MKYTLTQVQSEVMKILEATINICDRNDILYYAQAGTVLGAIRHHGPIPWDYDADIIVPNNLINRFVECVSRELPDKYYVDH